LRSAALAQIDAIMQCARLHAYDFSASSTP
jgi:hypothetical protein